MQPTCNWLATNGIGNLLGLNWDRVGIKQKLGIFWGESLGKVWKAGKLPETARAKPSGKYCRNAGRSPSRGYREAQTDRAEILPGRPAEFVHSSLPESDAAGEQRTPTRKPFATFRRWLTLHAVAADSSALSEGWQPDGCRLHARAESPRHKCREHGYQTDGHTRARNLPEVHRLP